MKWYHVWRKFNGTMLSEIRESPKDQDWYSLVYHSGKEHLDF